MVKKTREQLEALKVVELRPIAKSVGIKNTHSFKKVDLIDAILSAYGNQSKEEQPAHQNNGNPVNMEQKMPYIEQAPIGTLVAFRLPNGKVKSAKIINRSTKYNKLKLETSYGRQFVVPYDDIIWVKTNDSWPRGVYNLLKGVDTHA